MGVYIISTIWSGLELAASIFFSGAFLEKKKQKKYLSSLFVATSIIICLYSNSGINKLLNRSVIQPLIHTDKGMTPAILHNSAGGTLDLENH